VKEEQKLKRKQSVNTSGLKPSQLQMPLELNSNPFLAIEACHKCRVPFDTVALRQYCRLCGAIFCVTCTSHRGPVPESGFEDRIPICEGCHRDRGKALAAQ